jgi:uncharacterized protein
MATALDTVRNLYRSLADGNVLAVLALFDPKIEWTEAARFPYYGGTWRGSAAIVEGLFEPLNRDWASFTVNAEQFVTEGDQVVSFGKYVGTHKATARSMTAAFAHHWTVHNGKLVRFVQHTDTAKVLETINQ